MPILCPPGPNPTGFSWYVKAGDDYMNYHMIAEKRVGETSVLIIRREGRYTTWVSEEPSRPDCEAKGLPVVVRREGITLFAWNRGAVLEDRLIDHFIYANRCLTSSVGSVNHVVTRLTRSCPECLAATPHFTR